MRAGPQEAELVSLIVVPKVSGTTRRSSLAMGTLRPPAVGASPELVTNVEASLARRVRLPAAVGGQ
jgi:hypothetical protein